MIMKKINGIIMIFLLLIISCNEEKKIYLVYDLDAKFPTLSEKDSLFLISTSEIILDSVLKSKKTHTEIVARQIEKSIINSDSLVYTMVFKTNENQNNIYYFYFDDKFNYLKYENEE